MVLEMQSSLSSPLILQLKQLRLNMTLLVFPSKNTLIAWNSSKTELSLIAALRHRLRKMVFK